MNRGDTEAHPIVDPREIWNMDSATSVFKLLQVRNQPTAKCVWLLNPNAYLPPSPPLSHSRLVSEQAWPWKLWMSSDNCRTICRSEWWRWQVCVLMIILHKNVHKFRSKWGSLTKLKLWSLEVFVVKGQFTCTHLALCYKIMLPWTLLHQCFTITTCLLIKDVNFDWNPELRFLSLCLRVFSTLICPVWKFSYLVSYASSCPQSILKHLCFSRAES